MLVAIHCSSIPAQGSLVRCRRENYGQTGQMDGHAMNHETILAVLSESRDDAKSLKEIALAMELEMTSYADWIRVERRLSSSLRALVRWGSWTRSAGREKKGTGSGIKPTGRPSRRT